jgi:CheY-like chemotaxis protein
VGRDGCTEPIRPRKVLIAGGIKMMQLSLGQLLFGNKYQLFFADSGEDAIAKAIGESPDLIIIDLSLPGMSGLEVVRKIRSLTSELQSVVSSSEMAVIAICPTEKDEALVREATQLHVSAVFSKPFPLKKLGDKVKELLLSASGEEPHRRTILVIDPEPRVRNLYENMFRVDGSSVVGVENATQALEKVESRHPDLIITEQNLPGLSGLEFLKSLNDAGVGIPVVFVSSSTNEEIVKEAKALGARQYVAKPFVIERLKGLVQELLQGSGDSATVVSGTAADS